MVNMHAPLDAAHHSFTTYLASATLAARCGGGLYCRVVYDQASGRLRQPVQGEGMAARGESLAPAQVESTMATPMGLAYLLGGVVVHGPLPSYPELRENSLFHVFLE